MYRDAGKVRDIDVSFVGNVSSYAERSTYLGYLKDNGIKLLVAGGQRDNLLSQEDFVDLFQRSKMTINFSRRPIRDDIHELKSRVTEAMSCGTLLLESENKSISQLYDPLEHYIPFGTPEDLLEKIRHYLEHEDERQRIAKAGWLKTTTEYNNVVFWTRDFRHAGSAGEGRCAGVGTAE